MKIFERHFFSSPKKLGSIWTNKLMRNMKICPSNGVCSWQYLVHNFPLPYLSSVAWGITLMRKWLFYFSMLLSGQEKETTNQIQKYWVCFSEFCLLKIWNKLLNFQPTLVFNILTNKYGIYTGISGMKKIITNTWINAQFYSNSNFS